MTDRRADRPNVVIVLADDMGFGDVGCYGADRIATPHVDAVAAAGVRFTDAHTPSAVCTPSRYGLLAGRYAWRTRLERGVLNGYGRPLIEPDRPTLASVLRGAGYATGCFGKWHLGLGWAGEGEAVDFACRIDGGPVDLGFDRFFGMPASLDFPPYVFIENDRVTAVPSGSKAVLYDSQRPGPCAPDFDDRGADQVFAREAARFIEDSVRTDAGRPFFVYLATSAPHRPCLAPERFQGASRAGHRGDKVAEFDDIVGQVAAALERAGVAERTLLVITSDNGARPGDVVLPDDEPRYRDRVRLVRREDVREDQLQFGHLRAGWVHYGHRSNGDWTGYKTDAWDGGHRVVFVARWPEQIPAGSTCGEIVCLTDLMATCAGLAGAALPDEAGEDSFDMRPALTGEAHEKPVRESVVHHSGQGMFALRCGRWKLINGAGSGGASELRAGIDSPDLAGQLYDLAADPAEERNLYYADRPEVVEELRALLARAREEGRTAPRVGGY